MAKGYALTDDNNQVLDGTGVVIPSPNYAGISIDNNSSATVIGLVDSFYLVTVFDTDMPEAVSNGANGSNNITVGATGVYAVMFGGDGESAVGNKTFEYDIFNLSNTSTTITDATQADPVVVTAAGHGLSNGNLVAIKSVGGMTEINDRIFTVQDISGDTFELTDNGGASPTNDIDGTGFTAYTTGGTVQLSTKTLVHAQRKFASGGGGDFGSFGNPSQKVSLTLNETIELYIKGMTDATNFTFEHVDFSIHRIA